MLGVATAQAASGVRALTQRSFRLSMDVRLKAPLLVVPQSSRSHRALLVDLGLITVGNRFSLLPAHGDELFPVVEQLEVMLTQLKLCRCVSVRERDRCVCLCVTDLVLL